MKQALVDTTDQELYVSLACCYNEKYERVKGSVGTQLVGERVKIILDEVRDLSLITHKQCLQHIGTNFILAYISFSFCYIGNII